MLIKKLILTLIFILGLVTIAEAADISTTTCPGAGCTLFDVSGQSSVGIQVTGTFVGTLTFYASIDGTNYVALLVTPATSGTKVSTATTVGLWREYIAGFTSIRVAFTAYTSGTATVVLSSVK